MKRQPAQLLRVAYKLRKRGGGGGGGEEREKEAETGGLLKIKTCPANALNAGSLLSFSFSGAHRSLLLLLLLPRIGIFPIQRIRFDFIADSHFYSSVSCSRVSSLFSFSFEREIFKKRRILLEVDFKLWKDSPFDRFFYSTTKCEK